jgi:hypothetical protein
MVSPETRQIDVAVLDDIFKGSPLEEDARISCFTDSGDIGVGSA